MNVYKKGLYILAALTLLLFITPVAQAASPGNTNTIVQIQNSFPSIVVDNNNIEMLIKPFNNQQGQLCVSLADAMRIFQCDFDFDDHEHIILHSVNKNICLDSSDYFRMQPVSPVKDATFDGGLNQIFLPLRPLAAKLDYLLKYDSSPSRINLASPSYQEYILQLKGSLLELQDSVSIPSILPQWGPIKPDTDLAQMWPGRCIIGGYYTTLLDKSPGRTTNIILSCRKINGSLVKSGEVFSFNHIVGYRGVENGYQMANTFMGKTVVPGIGGGICQTASTLYNAVLQSNLKVVERWPHSLKVAYAPENLDATVAWGAADFKFYNNSGINIKIFCSVYKQYLFFAIFSAGKGE